MKAIPKEVRGEIVNVNWKEIFFANNYVNEFFPKKELVRKMRKTKAYEENWKQLKRKNRRLYKEFQKAKKIEYKLTPEFELLRSLFPREIETPSSDRKSPKIIFLAFTNINEREEFLRKYRDFYLLVETFWSDKVIKASTHDLLVYKVEVSNIEHWFKEGDKI